VQQEYASWISAPGDLHHKRAMLTALSKGLVCAAATNSPGGATSAQLKAALTALIPRLLVFMDLDTDPHQLGVAEAAHAGLLRLTAAVALLTVGLRVELHLPPHAYVTLALTAQDPMEEVCVLKISESFQCDLIHFLHATNGFDESNYCRKGRSYSCPARWRVGLHLASLVPKNRVALNNVNAFPRS
jgi:hypothetical protein